MGGNPLHSCLFLFVYICLFLFLFCSLTDTSPVIFHDAYFYYMAGVVPCFSRHAILRRSFGEYFHPTISFPPDIVSLSIH
jgi:hypothetical protein